MSNPKWILLHLVSVALTTATAVATCWACLQVWPDADDTVDYFCAASGVEYVKTRYGIAVHLSAGGQPVLCAEVGRK